MSFPDLARRLRQHTYPDLWHNKPASGILGTLFTDGSTYGLGRFDELAWSLAATTAEGKLVSAAFGWVPVLMRATARTTRRLWHDHSPPTPSRCTSTALDTDRDTRNPRGRHGGQGQGTRHEDRRARGDTGWAKTGQTCSQIWELTHKPPLRVLHAVAGFKSVANRPLDRRPRVTAAQKVVRHHGPRAHAQEAQESSAAMEGQFGDNFEALCSTANSQSLE